HAPPYGRASLIALSKPSRPASTAPVVSTYSWTRTGRVVARDRKSLARAGPVGAAGQEVHRVTGPGHEPVQRDGEVQQHLAGSGLGWDLGHAPILARESGRPPPGGSRR